MLTAIGADTKALIVTPAVDAKLVKSAANIPGVKTATADSINTYEVPVSYTHLAVYKRQVYYYT